MSGASHASIVPSDPQCAVKRLVLKLSSSVEARGVTTPLHVRHDESADRAVTTASPETNMAMVVLTRLHLLTLEQIASRDVEPAGSCLHQLIAGDREAIHTAAAS